MQAHARHHAGEAGGVLALVSLDDTMRSQVDPLVAARAGPPTGKRPNGKSHSRGLIIMLFGNSGFMPYLKNLMCH